MGILGLFNRTQGTTLLRLPSGSFTLDRFGRVLASTLPQSFPPEVVEQIGKLVLSTFSSAQSAEIPLSELAVEFATLKITARELRGGAIVFLAPRGLATR